MAKRHYRTGRRKASQATPSGVLLSKKERRKYLTIAGGVLVLVFLKGLLIGFLAGRQD